MGSRIITLQRQARELGRLRTGYSVPNEDPKKRPRAVRSKTWIVSSHAEHYVQAAAEVWGGQVEKWQPQGNGAAQWRVMTAAESLDAILPPGDPLSQAYETWSAGGAQRRCDGMTESLGDQPCVCRAQWGELFWENAPRDKACKMTTRLNVILPEMPDIGAWRVETHSFYSANEMAAAVDVLKGSIGEQALIPVRLRIEQRTRVAQGKTKQFPVVAVELRGSTAGQVLAGAAQVVPVGTGSVEPVPAAAAVAGGSRTAIEGGQSATPVGPTAEEFLAQARTATTFAQFKAIWDEAGAARVSPSEAQVAEMKAIGARLKDAAPAAVEQAPPTPPAAPAAGPSEADALWQQIVAVWPGTTSELNTAFAQVMGGVAPDTASEAELDEFLKKLKAGEL
ncbi:recombination directionality factor [Streptosporangium sp. V21-05]|uniref:recombination directionality factor n=1 Tax=Streptosporangium sp. V21-05 TaxID=3446115 RepID=UPI003F5299A1